MRSEGLLYILLVYLCIFCTCDFTEDGAFSSNYVIVETSSGKLVGRKQGPVNTFLGIPYAEPPTGIYRFRPPRPKLPWYPKLLQAVSYGPECLQSTLYYDNGDTAPMDEDCLFLNIWQPTQAVTVANSELSGQLYPVMIWIYGGAFIHGSASKAEYEGSRLAARKNGAIVVSLNYRLGALGFVVSTADGLYGNNGLDDQKTAIQWVKNNIIHFGGDPNRITLFGESAGAMSIGLHMLDQQQLISSYQEYEHSVYEGRRRAAPINSGFRHDQQLFHSVIMQSNPIGYK
jgi:para-nitrobenzyl esterase